MYYLLRWLLFFFVGMPFQLLTYILYPLLVIYYVVYARNKLKGDAPSVPDATRWPYEDLVQLGLNDAIRDESYIATSDDHSALQHMYTWILRPNLGYEGLKNLVNMENKTLHRRFPDDPYHAVSGDCLSSWVAAFTYRFANDMPCPESKLKMLANSYIKNCMGLPARSLGWKVSNRSSNSGVNYTPDSWLKLNQPALGPQYFTSAALLLLAARVFGGWYWIVYFIHYWMMGGWLYTIFPMLHTHNNHFYYAQHITVVAMYSVAKLSRNPIYRWSMWWVNKFMSPRRFINPLFECWAADACLSNKKDIDECLERCTKFKHVWPQVWPGWHDWYNEDKWPKGNQQTVDKYSVVAGAAKMLKDSRRCNKP